MHYDVNIYNMAMALAYDDKNHLWFHVIVCFFFLLGHELQSGSRYCSKRHRGKDSKQLSATSTVDFTTHAADEESTEQIQYGEKNRKRGGGANQCGTLFTT